MSTVFKLIVYMIVFVELIRVNTEDRVIMLAEERTYAADIIASHDAAVVSKAQKAEGYIVFDEAAGTRNFKKSLAANLGLNLDLTPQNASIFSGSIKIVGLLFIGDNKVPHDALGRPIYPFNVVQPVVYRGETITIRETILGPSVIGLIEAPINVSGNPVKLKTAVYRYLDKQL